jgi:hypothetical protein
LTRGERHGGSGAKDGETSLLGEVLAMGRGTGPEKHRGRGEGAGAEDRELWAETVRNGAVDGEMMAATTAAVKLDRTVRGFREKEKASQIIL